MKRALITGVGGQTGSYLAELLLEQDYEVHGLVRRSSIPNTGRIDHLLPRLKLHFGDMTDTGSIEAAVIKSRPDEIYNLAAMSQVRISYDIPANTLDVTGCGLSEADRGGAAAGAGSEGLSGIIVRDVRQGAGDAADRAHALLPAQPYGCAKAMAFYLGRSYREGYGLRIYNGILFNHESPRRGDNFLSKKVVKAAAAIKRGEQDKLHLGNLDAKRDMGSAKEYAYWIWRIMQHDTPDDFLLATGETHSMQEFVEEAFGLLGLNWRDHVVIDDNLKRPAEVDLLMGDASKARRVLGFEPKVKFKGLVEWMVEAEMGVELAHA
jgi:GDPmannose 4,6-dehydratase